MENTVYKIINGSIITPSKIIKEGQLVMINGKIVEIGTANIEIPHAHIIDAQEGYIAPGCIDMHVHGGNGHDFLDATPEVFYDIAKAHALHGTTTIYPTLAASELQLFWRAIRSCEQAMRCQKQGANILGLHLEGNSLLSNKSWLIGL